MLNCMKQEDLAGSEVRTHVMGIYTTERFIAVILSVLPLLLVCHNTMLFLPTIIRLSPGK